MLPGPLFGSSALEYKRIEREFSSSLSSLPFRSRAIRSGLCAATLRIAHHLLHRLADHHDHHHHCNPIDQDQVRQDSRNDSKNQWLSAVDYHVEGYYSGIRGDDDRVIIIPDTIDGTGGARSAHRPVGRRCRDDPLVVGPSRDGPLVAGSGTIGPPDAHRR